jgi:glycosyltransferase involved in cell wall biosynthesis
MRILALMNQPSGVDFHRIIKPLTRLHIDEGIDVFKAQDIEKKGIPQLTDYDLVVFNRYLYKNHYSILEYMAKHNVPYVIDIDDWWKLPKHHPAFDWYRKNKVPKAIEDAIRYASGVTVSTEGIAALVRPLNPRVSILPNALDTTDEQWNWPKTESDRVRVGWLAGITHHNDASIIGPAISEAMGEVDFDFIYCGFSDKPLNRSMLYRLNNGEKEMKIHCMNGMSPETYGKMLAQLDIAVAPLEDTAYNRCKSDIKIQEAAAYGLPIICSDVGPYSEYRDTNGVMVVKNTTADWADALAWHVENLGKVGRLNMEPKHNIEQINKKRLAFYEQCVNSSTHVRG